MNKPLVSIIIPSSRPLFVEETIKSILRQDFGPKGQEITVVGKVSRRIKQKYKIKTIEGKFYPGEARNLGAKITKGTYLLFIDDDCEAGRDWIKNNIDALRNKKIGAVSGMVIGKSNKFFARCTDFSNFDLCQTSERGERVLCSATMGIRREVFREIGGFSEDLRVGEDLDLCYKLIKEGYKTVYEPKIKVFHGHKKDSLPKLLGYMWFGGKHSGFFTSKKYPNFDRNAKIFIKTQNPYLFIFFVLPFSLFMTFKSIKINFKEHKKVLVYAPFIFLAKLSYTLGIFSWLLSEGKRQNAR